jgi:hypothetical protein
MNEEVRLNTCYLEFVTAYFETWSRRKSGLEKSPNPDWEKTGLVFEKTRGLDKRKPRTRNEKKTDSKQGLCVREWKGFLQRFTNS